MKKFLVLLVLASIGRLFWQSIASPGTSIPVQTKVASHWAVSPPTGLRMFLPDIYHEISYPPQALNHCVTGLVTIHFDLYKSGAMSHIKIAHGLGYGIDEEILRAFNNCRKYPLPIHKNDQIVKKFEINISFMINGTSASSENKIIINSQTFRDCTGN